MTALAQSGQRFFEKIMLKQKDRAGFGDVTPAAALAFASTGGAFSVAGAPIAVNSALVEGGIDWRLTSQIKLGIGYQGELARHAQTQMANGNFTWNF